MKHRPTEIPYIPKDKRRSRYAPREGGKIVANNRGIKALGGSNAGSWVKRGKRKDQGGCGCAFLVIMALVAFSDQLREGLQGIIEDMGSRVVTERSAPVDVQSPPPTIIEAVGEAQGPRGDLRGIFSTDDYPTDSLRAEEEGTVRAQLTIDPEGIPTACEVIQSSGFSRLDDVTCRLMMDRARFAPALDANGQPVFGIFTPPPVRWEIPRG